MKVFIGSSSESKSDMRTVAHWIESQKWVAECWDNSFRAGDIFLPRLLEISRNVNGAILIFSEDDEVLHRDNRKMQPRDNILLEYGLFAGALGPKKTIICLKGKPKLPSDLGGVTYVNLDPSATARHEISTWLDEIKPPVPTFDPHTLTEELDQLIERSKGVTSRNPIAFAVSLLPNGQSIKPDVKAFLEYSGWEMNVEELIMSGINNKEDIKTLIMHLNEKRRQFTSSGVTEIHLFIAGPVQAGTIIGSLYSNWKSIKLYHKPNPSPPETYAYWMPLYK